jgi:hypothetical protein
MSARAFPWPISERARLQIHSTSMVLGLFPLGHKTNDPQLRSPEQMALRFTPRWLYPPSAPPGALTLPPAATMWAWDTTAT